MKDLMTVIEFTMKDMIKRKSFIISTLILVIGIIVGFSIPGIAKKFKGDNSNDKLLVVDSQNVFEGTLESLNSMNLGYDCTITNDNVSYDQIKNKINNDETKEVIVIEKNNNNINIKYFVKNTDMMSGVDIPQNIKSALSSIYGSLQISKLGLSAAQLESITPNFQYSFEQTGEQKASGNLISILLLSIVLFYAIYFCAYQVSSSITTEKTSKIMETLVTSTSPRTIVMGKTIGIGIVGLLQVCVLVITALISAKYLLDPGTLNSIVDVSKITPMLGITVIIYFILGYFEYALVYALTGSTVSKPEDIQSANTPVALIAVVGFYLSYFTMMNPTSNLNIFASMFPISSPFCMPFRVMMGLAGIKDIAISLIILLVTILLIAKVSIKIYSNAILNYGTKMSLKDIIKVCKNKNA